MIDVCSTLVPDSSGKPLRVLTVVAATAEELLRMAQTIEQAVHGSPAAAEFVASNGVAHRFIFDRMGEKVPTQ